MNLLQYFLSPGDPTQFCKNRCVETKCGEFVVPEEHLTACSTCNSRGRECGLKEEEGEGVDDVDFLLYVSARDTKQCGGKIGEGCNMCLPVQGDTGGGGPGLGLV